MTAASTRWTPSTLSRIAGLLAIATTLVTLGYFGSSLSPPFGPPEPSAQQILAWVSANQSVLLFQFIIGFQGILYAMLLVTLVALLHGRGILANLAHIGAAAIVAISLVSFGIFVGLWTLVQRTGSDGGIVALMSAAQESYTHATLIAVALGVGSVSVLALRSRTLPRWLGWLGLVMAVEHALSPVVFAVGGGGFSTTSSGAATAGGGIIRPVDLVLEFAWLVATGVVLLVKPVRLAPNPNPD